MSKTILTKNQSKGFRRGANVCLTGKGSSAPTDGRVGGDNRIGIGCRPFKSGPNKVAGFSKGVNNATKHGKQ